MLLTQNLFGISVTRVFQISAQRVDSNIMFVEKDEILLKNKKTNVFNSYFDSVTDSLDLFSWATQTDNKNTPKHFERVSQSPKFNQN